MNTEITKHGLRWYFDGKQPQCPECNTNNVVCIKKITSIRAQFRCMSCFCDWTQTRDERGECGVRIITDVQTGVVSIRYARQDDLVAHAENLAVMVAHNREHVTGEEPHLLYIILPEHHPENHDHSESFGRRVVLGDKLVPIKEGETEADALRRMEGGGE